MRSEIFEGTAGYYARYRPDYPPALYQAARDAFGLDETPRGALLDLGTGPGFVALALARHFERVAGIDVDAEMLRHAGQAAAVRGMPHAAWHHLAAEDIDVLDGTPSGGPYRLVTVGSAFHWMDQHRVLALVEERLEADGGIFFAGFPGFINVDEDSEADPISATVAPVIHRYLGPRRRAGSGVFTPPPKRWEDFLAEARYREIESGEEPLVVEFNVDEIMGLVYSTSFANRRLLGERVEAFEADLRAALMAAQPAGRYTRTFTAEWVLGRAPRR